MRKSDRHEAIRARCSRAIANMYHNATPSYPRLNDADGERFQAWFEDAAQFEIEYIQSGGAYGPDYVVTLRHPANAGRYKSEAARNYYVRKGMRSYREELQPWELLTQEFGKLYTWGRGGRTLAPDDLVKTHGGSRFSMNEDWPAERSIAEVVEATRIVESFNRYVASWCESVPEQWAEVERDRIEEEKREENQRRARKAAQTRAVNANYRGL